MQPVILDNPGTNDPESAFWHAHDNSVAHLAELVRRSRLIVGVFGLAIIAASFFASVWFTLLQRKAECLLSAAVVYGLGFYAAFKI
ncbi:hypothetical protein [Rhizobium oryzicola]|uniref:Uncharacterized protein n=1 Tax=Rhizobium oryzicola TaxID=1232668 RepID=A0ABT8SVE9_9HYPH|nr:hypothetical protein [Rhizobium oryzicola]MDO1582403.1 hypothetical protein [Rhizobium oryzicola]